MCMRVRIAEWIWWWAGFFSLSMKHLLVGNARWRTSAVILLIAEVLRPLPAFRQELQLRCPRRRDRSQYPSQVLQCPERQQLPWWLRKRLFLTTKMYRLLRQNSISLPPVSPTSWRTTSRSKDSLSQWSSSLCATVDRPERFWGITNKKNSRMNCFSSKLINL